MYDRSRFEAEEAVSNVVLELFKLPDYLVYQRILEALLIKMMDTKSLPEAAAAGTAALVRGDLKAESDEDLQANVRVMGMAMTLKGSDYWEKRYGFSYPRWLRQYGQDKELSEAVVNQLVLYTGREMTLNKASFWIRFGEEFMKINEGKMMDEFVNVEVTWAGILVAELPTLSKRNLELVEAAKQVNGNYLRWSMAENEQWPSDWAEWMSRTVATYAYMKGGSAKSRQVIRPYVLEMWKQLETARYHGNKGKPIESRAEDVVLMLEHLLRTSRSWLTEKMDNPVIQQMSKTAQKWAKEYEYYSQPKGLHRIIKAEEDVAVFGCAWKIITKQK